MILYRQYYSAILMCFFICSCSLNGPLVEVTLVDERTALENQILGSYSELNNEVMLLASVRYIDPQGHLQESPAVPPGKKEVIRALQRISFNKDDIDHFKKLGLIGENNLGGISLFDKTIPENVNLEFVKSLVKEENQDRDVIMARVVETNENLEESELVKVQNIFAALNRDKAETGQMIQLEDSSWIAKGENSLE